MKDNRITFIQFYRPDGCIDYSREVTYRDGVPHFRTMSGGYTPVSETDLKRPCMYQSGDDRGLLYKQHAIDVVNESMFSEVKR